MNLDKNSILLFVAFLTARMLDLLTTYWATPTLERESSILIVALNFGWCGFILANIALVTCVLVILLFVSKNEIKLLENKSQDKINTISDYYYRILFKNNIDINTPNIMNLIFKGRINARPALYFAVHSLLWTLIIVGYLFSVNNVFVYFGKPLFVDIDPFMMSNIVFLFLIALYTTCFAIFVKSRYKKFLTDCKLL